MKINYKILDKVVFNSSVAIKCDSEESAIQIAIELTNNNYQEWCTLVAGSQWAFSDYRFKDKSIFYYIKDDGRVDFEDTPPDHLLVVLSDKILIKNKTVE